MKRWIAIVLLTLAGCAGVTAGSAIEVNVHCGMGYPRIEIDGELWRFDTEGRTSRAAKWDTGLTVTMHIRQGGDGRPIITDPDGGEWTLVRANDEPSGCI